MLLTSKRLFFETVDILAHIFTSDENNLFDVDERYSEMFAVPEGYLSNFKDIATESTEHILTKSLISELITTTFLFSANNFIALEASKEENIEPKLELRKYISLLKPLHSVCLFILAYIYICIFFR